MSRYTPLWLQQGTYAASLDRRLIGALWPAAACSGLAVSPGTAMSVNIAAGSIAVPLTAGTGSVLCVSDAVENVALNPAPGAGSNRIDVIYCQVRGNDIDSGSNNDFFFGVITGVAAASPSPSPVPNNSVALAQVYVPAQSASVTAGNITMQTTRRLSPGGPDLPGVPAGRLWASTQTVLASATTGQIGLQTADYLYGGMTQSGSGLVVPVAGIYRVAVSIAWQVSNGQVPASTGLHIPPHREVGLGAGSAVLLSDELGGMAGDERGRRHQVQRRRHPHHERESGHRGRRRLVCARRPHVPLGPPRELRPVNALLNAST